jgi:hypothetical protein
MCTGNIFDATRKMFKDRNIRCVDTKIEGPLQTKVEQALLDHLKIIGVTNPNITIESGKERFFQLFHWVSKDFHKRQKYVKSGFAKWEQKWEAICLDEYHKNLGRNGRRYSNDDNVQKKTSDSIKVPTANTEQINTDVNNTSGLVKPYDGPKAGFRHSDGKERRFENENRNYPHSGSRRNNYNQERDNPKNNPQYKGKPQNSQRKPK